MTRASVKPELLQWARERSRVAQEALAGGSGGGDYYRLTLTCVSRRFAQALPHDVG